MGQVYFSKSNVRPVLVIVRQILTPKPPEMFLVNFVHAVDQPPESPNAKNRPKPKTSAEITPACNSSVLAFDDILRTGRR